MYCRTRIVILPVCVGDVRAPRATFAFIEIVREGLTHYGAARVCLRRPSTLPLDADEHWFRHQFHVEMGPDAVAYDPRKGDQLFRGSSTVSH
jgi:hypothetical protein